MPPIISIETTLLDKANFLLQNAHFYIVTTIGYALLIVNICAIVFTHNTVTTALPAI